MSAFTSADVSVIIPSYNSRTTIAACLTSLQQQTTSPLEIIVADSSDDGTAQLIQNKFPMVRVWSFKTKRVFPGPGRNQGARIARGSILAFIDADCIAAPDWIERTVTGHNCGHQIVGGAVEVGNLSSQIAWAGHLGEFREFLPLGSARRVLHVPTCNNSYRKALFDAHGGFPDAYYPQEDLLFNYMLSRKGYYIWFDPEIRVRHFCREDLHAFLSHQHRIGRVTRSTLRRIELPGSSLARRAWLAWLAAPALGLVKFARTTSTFARFFPQELKQRPLVLPLLALGTIWWTRGFAAGARRGLSGIKGWDDPDEPIFQQLLALNGRTEGQ